MGIYSRDDTGFSIDIGNDGTYTHRGFIEFDTASIPDHADIEDVVLNVTFTSLGDYNCDVNELESKVYSASDENLYKDIGNGTSYIDNDAFCKSGSSFYPSLDLGSDSDFKLQELLEDNWFGVGIKWNDESSYGSLAYIYPSEDTAGFIPVLVVNYNLDIVHDANGNIIKGLGKSYVYNDFNKLSKERNKNSTGDLIEEYAYDQNGQRWKKVSYNIDNKGNNQTSYYIDPEFINIRNTNGTIFNETYYSLNGKQVALEFNGNTNRTYYHNDHLGSTTLVTNQSADIIEENFFNPFGDIYSGGEDSRFLYTGQEFDRLINLYYYGARYYQASILRRFISPDSVIADLYNPQNLNRYSYVLNNPYKYVDPNCNEPTTVPSPSPSPTGSPN